MKLPAFNTPDYSTAPDWFKTVVAPWTAFLRAVSSTLQRNLTIKENLKVQVYEGTMSPALTFPVNILKEFPTRAIKVELAQCNKLNNVNDPATTGSIGSWTDDGGIRINSILVDNPAETYSIRVLIWY